MADTWKRALRRSGVAMLACVLAAASGPVLAQGGASRAVVQPVPPPALDDLNAALKDLSHDPANVAALLRAGWASLGIDDAQAALGFFRRAAAVQPQNGEIKAGLATALLRQGDPVSAVRLFAEAEAARAPMARFAADRGLALDLVGSNAAAQPFYRQALAQGNDPEVVRRLALSQAIAGDQAASDATLLPLLQHRDLAAYRTRAFALAILGKGEEAVSIAQTMLPAQISSRLAPYLRYMPRLTRAQQAAAANLGQFPPASEIGRDDPQIAAFSGSAAAAPQVASAAPGARLVPTGEPLGRSDRRESASTKAPARDPKEEETGSGADGGVR
jgi:Flp pilus assembly protein TadD